MKKSRGTLSFVMPEIFNQASKSSVIPEIFNRESTPLRHSRNLLSGIQGFLLFLWFLNTVDPGLKIAGVTRRWESRGFCL